MAEKKERVSAKQRATNLGNTKLKDLIPNVDLEEFVKTVNKTKDLTDSLALEMLINDFISGDVSYEHTIVKTKVWKRVKDGAKPTTEQKEE